MSNPCTMRKCSECGIDQFPSGYATDTAKRCEACVAEEQGANADRKLEKAHRTLEREGIVAWLRIKADRARDQQNEDERELFRGIANSIENGAHRTPPPELVL